MNIGGTEVTKREFLFSIIIFLIIIAIGIYSVGIIKGKIEEKNERYYKALKINNNTNDFNYAQKTNAGDALIYGNIKAVDTVSIPEVDGDYIYISRNHERYTKHTRTVTTTVNGKRVTKLETYWTWDVVGEESYKSKEIEILDNIYGIERFNLEKLVKKLNISDNNFIKIQRYKYVKYGYVYSDSHNRYYYSYIPKEVIGNMLVNFSNNTINPIIGKKIVVEYGTIEEKLESLKNSVKNTALIIWIVIIVFTLVIIYKFISGYHYWLEK